MELNDSAKAAARELGDAINSAISSSEEVAAAIVALRSLDYEPHVSVKLNVALARIDEGETDELDIDAAETLLTPDDIKTLRRMKISFD
ncbi:MAG: hypothetical protein ACR2IH_13825 [Pyrinomonadaceae bacterium]